MMDSDSYWLNRYREMTKPQMGMAMPPGMDAPMPHPQAPTQHWTDLPADNVGPSLDAYNTGPSLEPMISEFNKTAEHLPSDPSTLTVEAKSRLEKPASIKSMEDIHKASSDMEKRIQDRLDERNILKASKRMQDTRANEALDSRVNQRLQERKYLEQK